MKITKALKDHLLKKGWIKEADTDDQVKSVAGAKLVSGEITSAEWTEFTKEAAPTGMAAVEAKIAAAVSPLITAMATLTETVTKALAAPTAAPQNNMGKSLAAATVTGTGVGIPYLGGGITVKKVSEYYKKEKVVGKHKSTGEPVYFMSRPVEEPSELELAKLGVLERFKATRNGFIAPKLHKSSLDEHEKQLLEEMWNEDNFWVNGAEDSQKLMSGLQLKTVLNDSTSGGTDVVPYWFDDMAITFPLLHSELLPYIDLRDVPFGTTTKGGSIGNPTLTWGSSEGTAFTEFVTTNLIGAFNQTIYPVVIGLELGIDFLSDSPMAVGAIVQQNIGQASLKELDNVIANGNGSSQPQGLFNASGTVAVSSINGTGGPFQVEDAEDLMFGIGKQYRAKPWNIAYVMNDTSYQRLRAVPVGPADARRVFGIDEQSYQLLGYPVRIQNGITNNQAALVALKKFILYRRRGWDLRTVTEGKTLALSNTVLYVGRGRFGGALSDGAAMAVMTNAPN